jgi:endonuclease/exonuclease/phosphatase family metal-dependent hydrolase
MARRIHQGLFGKCIVATALACAASSLAPSSALAVTDTWNPAHENAVFFRNNTLLDFYVDSASRVALGSGCSLSSGGYDYTNGSSPDVDAAAMVEVLNVNSPYCLTPSSRWKFPLKKVGCSDTHYIHVDGMGAFSTNGTTFSSSSEYVNLTFCGTTVTVNLYGRDYLHESGAYVTIGTDPFGKLGPTRNAANVNELTVTSYNTYQGTNAKPEICDRGEFMASILPLLDTDVLVLQEMNLRENDCFDGLELAAYLWTGDMSSTNDDHIENDGYACSTSGSGSSPNGNDKYAGANGAFPYISQFVSGIAVGGNENETGGVVILSKYPITMLENRTYANVESGKEQKGFITAKITKSYNGVPKDYYIVATHTSADEDDRPEQIDELAEYLSTTGDIPSGARVILTGDLNTNGQAGEMADLGVSVVGYPNQTHTEYYPYSRDSSVDFYHQDGSAETIDWVQPVSIAGRNFASAASFNWHVFPIRDTDFKFADLSDHLAVVGKFTY